MRNRCWAILTQKTRRNELVYQKKRYFFHNDYAALFAIFAIQLFSHLCFCFLFDLLKCSKVVIEIVIESGIDSGIDIHIDMISEDRRKCRIS